MNRAEARCPWWRMGSRLPNVVSKRGAAMVLKGVVPSGLDLEALGSRRGEGEV